MTGKFTFCNALVKWRGFASVQLVFEIFGGLLIVLLLLITSPIWLFVAWLKRNEPIKLKKHHIRRLKEIHEAKQQFKNKK